LYIHPVVDFFGTKSWYDENGNSHREDGPAYEDANGAKIWYWHGQLHREESMNILMVAKIWYWHGQYHREDGPAIERADGTKEWYLHGKYFENEEFLRMIKLKAFW
jgi:hypothetical protein